MVVRLVKEFINITRETYRNEEKSSPFDTQTALVCVLGALSLLLLQFIAKTGKFIYFLRELNLHEPLTILSPSFCPLAMEI